MPLPNKMDYAELGGEKADYEAVVDAETELSAEEINATRCAVAMMSRMVPRAMVSFSYNSTVTVEDHEALWGNDAAYAPEVVRNSAGNFTVTWPTEVTDERGATTSINFVRGWVNVESAGYIPAAIVESANSVTVRVASHGGTNSDAGGAVITLYVR